MSASRHTREQKLQAVELAAVHGPTKTARALKIPTGTLTVWCYQDFRNEYTSFREGQISEWRRSFAAEMEDLAQNYGEVERKALDVAERLLEDPDVEAKDVASLIKGMGAARSSASSVGGKARGEPDEVVQHQINFPQLERIAAAIKQAEIEGTAVELEETSG